LTPTNVWQHRGDGILQSLHQGPLPDESYAREMPADIREASTGVPVVDQAVHALYATGMLHNHARMWLASYAPESWHSPGSVIDTSYEALDRMARQPAQPGRRERRVVLGSPSSIEPRLTAEPPDEVGCTVPDPAAVAGRDVWLVPPWSLGELPASLPADTQVIGVFVADFHRAWPWNNRRWHFVGTRMTELASQRWYGDAAVIGAALNGARRVRSIAEPHLAPWLARWADCRAASALFPPVDRRCDSFSQWWRRATRGLDSAASLLAVNEVPAG
jgi:deoxyribodipyrimidine photo-lyase